jgi:hypothetical protein
LDNQAHQTRGARESVWSILAQWQSAYFILFAIQNIAGISLVCWYEITQQTQDSVVETILAISQGTAPIAVGSAAATITLMETVRSVMVIAASLDRWLKEKEAKRIERRRAEGRAEGRVEAHKAWSEWNRQRLEAEAKGESFAEPPPDFSEAGPSPDG